MPFPIDRPDHEDPRRQARTALLEQQRLSGVEVLFLLSMETGRLQLVSEETGVLVRWGHDTKAPESRSKIFGDRRGRRLAGEGARGETSGDCLHLGFQENHPLENGHPKGLARLT
jgi:hypothetical protein